jgi:hypothetical protein
MALLDVVDLVGGALTTSGVTQDFGEEKLATGGAPPRVIWVPKQDSFASPQWRGSILSDPKALYTCMSGVDLHCWGESTAAAIALRDDVIRALRKTIGANFDLASGSLIGQAWATRGRVYLLSAIIHIPVTEVAPTVVQVTALTQDIQVQH